MRGSVQAPRVCRLGSCFSIRQRALRTRVPLTRAQAEKAQPSTLQDDILRGLPLWSGGVGFISILANRALSEVEPVVDASSSQSRADVLAIVMSAVLLLTGLSWLSLKPRIAEAVPLEGSDVDFIEKTLPAAAVAEFRWAWKATAEASKARAFTAFYRGKLIAHFGKGPLGSYDPAAATYGPICQRVMETGEGNYLANLAPYPGRNEFFRYLPEQTQAVLLCPLGKEGVVVFASDTQRGFGPLDQAWASAVSDKIDSTLEEAGWYPKGLGFGVKAGKA